MSEYRQVTKDKSPVKTANQQESVSNSHVKQVTKSVRSNNVGNVKMGLGYNVEPQSRFTSPKADRPRSTSPKTRNFESQSHRFSTPRRKRTPLRFHTPQRTVNRFSSVSSHENYRDNRVSHQGRIIGMVKVQIIPINLG